MSTYLHERRLRVALGLCIWITFCGAYALNSNAESYEFSENNRSVRVNKYNEYDIVVVGAGPGGIAAAIQIARMGIRVALLEETDQIGGQLITVPQMDESIEKYISAVRESGLYAEFVDRVSQKYFDMRKSHGTCYFRDSSMCFEPHVVTSTLAELIEAEPNLDILLNTEVTDVSVVGNRVESIVVNSTIAHSIKVLIDATEYGDLLPLAGVAYRVGNSSSDDLNLDACIQDTTYTTIIKKYPSGSPTGFFMKTAPPKYYDIQSLFADRYWNHCWYVDPNCSIYTNRWQAHAAYRGTPNSSDPNNYDASPDKYELITKTGVNWINDYSLTVRYLEDKEYRRQIDCEAKLRTLQFIYFAQHDVGESKWSIANDELFDSPYNFAHTCSNIPSEFKSLEVHMPVRPYVRESRRIVPIHTLKGSEIKRVGETSDKMAYTAFKDSVSVGYYGTDLHGCKDNASLELEFEDEEDFSEFSGPYQIPIHTLIPRDVDGFLAAEKNIGVTRIVNGSIRLQPIAMDIGQAAGTIAALSVIQGLDPRDVDPLTVQKQLLDSNVTLSLYRYNDVPRTKGYWKHVQLASTRKVMKGVSPTEFRPDDAMPRHQAAVVISSLLGLAFPPPVTAVFKDVPIDHPQFAYINNLYQAGITRGCVPDQRFCPDKPITRAEFAVFLVKGLKLPLYRGEDKSFIDVLRNHTFYEFIETASRYGLITGYPDKTFRPDIELKRYQAAVAIYPAYELAD